jgi:hypothetical protein
MWLLWMENSGCGGCQLSLDLVASIVTCARFLVPFRVHDVSVVPAEDLLKIPKTADLPVNLD